MARNILVVESERHIMRLIQVNLERAGYMVALAFSGQEAISLVESVQPELLIIDQTLSDMTGNDLGQRIREMQVASRPVALLLIPKGITGNWLGDWYRYPDVFIAKPFNPQELVRFATEALQTRSH